MSVPVAVKVRDTAIIPCYKTCNGDVLWALTTKNEKLDVLRCVQGRCTEGFSFKNRVHLSHEKINSGNLSLIMSPVLYNDEGHTKYGSGFTGRASVSLHHYKDGDLSLNILGVTTSDKGLYRCYHNTNEEHGYPSAVSLIVTGCYFLNVIPFRLALYSFADCFLKKKKKKLTLTF
uniref:Immunoglobulin V-set domain-containing protein n=1 Tax=Cyprinus carpio TaxID=7962 RepID=A0A8C1YQ20_CYPCA